MYYVIEKVEKAVIALTKPGNAMAAMKAENNTALISEWATEKERIRLQIMEEVFTMHEESQLRLLIDRYQGTLTRLMDELYSNQKSIKKSDAVGTHRKILYDLLNELLNFLTINYGQYFNFFRKAPLQTIENSKEKIKIKLSKVIRMLEQKIANENLRALVAQPFKDFADVQMSFKEIQYAQFALDKLTAAETNTMSEDPMNILKEQLLYINFNSPGIISFYINELQEMINAEESVQGKLRILKYQHKEINQVMVEPNQALHNNYPGLKQQLLNRLQDEISFYEHEQHSIATLPASIPVDNKIHTSLSVPQLALLFRLMKEEKLITNANQSELLKVVAYAFTTANKEQFSYGHLHGKYYKIEPHTKRTVYDLLIRLLHQSKKIG